jgi:hypothetical protein
MTVDAVPSHQDNSHKKRAATATATATHHASRSLLGPPVVHIMLGKMRPS